MNRKIRKQPLACLAVLPLAGMSLALSADEAVYSRSVQAPFEDVSFGVESAIENRGYVIDYHARIGDMLERTAADVGAEDSPYADAETWQFCSATLSRRTMEADPINVAYCPYVVFAYSTAADPDTVVVGFRTHAGVPDTESVGPLADVDRELAAIVDEAVE